MVEMGESERVVLMDRLDEPAQTSDHVVTVCGELPRVFATLRVHRQRFDDDHSNSACRTPSVVGHVLRIDQPIQATESGFDRRHGESVLDRNGADFHRCERCDGHFFTPRFRLIYGGVEPSLRTTKVPPTMSGSRYVPAIHRPGWSVNDLIDSPSMGLTPAMFNTPGSPWFEIGHIS
jgi:hypothetical protein